MTGAAGFIGSHLVERLLDRGDIVIGIDNFDPFYSPAEKEANLARALASDRFQLIRADCADQHAMESALRNEDFDIAVHLAGKAGVRPSIGDPIGYVRANVEATQVLLEVLRARGVRRLIFGSSSSVYGNDTPVPFNEDSAAGTPISPYAATKRAAELLCYTSFQLHAISTIALRFFTVYGPRQRPDLAIRKFATLMLRNEPLPLFGDGTTERDYTWVDDIIDGVVAAMDRTAGARPAFEVINLGGHHTTSLRRLVELLEHALGLRARTTTLPAQPGDVTRTFADVRKARDLLGYVPRTRIEDGIPRFVGWLREHEGQKGKRERGKGKGRRPTGKREDG